MVKRVVGGHWTAPKLGDLALANKIEAFYKKPEDIEWAIVDGQVYLLQSRPITTMK